MYLLKMLKIYVELHTCTTTELCWSLISHVRSSRIYTFILYMNVYYQEVLKYTLFTYVNVKYRSRCTCTTVP